LTTAGAVVERNEVIALSGSSGRSTAPHLHFEIFQNGVPVDPLGMVTQP
jgi:murein DD-endopeptidase MepM/ murein hydrolase activator NlpD